MKYFLKQPTVFNAYKGALHSAVMPDSPVMPELSGIRGSPVCGLPRRRE